MITLIINQLTQPELSGLVKVGTPEDYTTRFLPEILAGFSRIYPNVQVEVSVLSSHNLIHLIKNEKLDLALTSTSEPTFQDSLLLRHEPSVWVVSPNHDIEEVRPIPLALFPTHDCLFRIWAVRELEKAGIDYRIAYTSESILGHIAAVSAGLAIAVMSESIVPKNLKIIAENTIFPKLPHSDIYLRKNQSANNPAIDLLADRIVKAFQNIRPD
ncbi:LysR substrate-binding domain-containing protein [Oceanispirochaeta sp. M1]|uniref:LysR substrate-binding domain-containing protein n=1 Tax=Oceanispirochaeta sp. M1 TaxID=2283433 RepID=UPI001F30F9CB|nr:LysR substrate-binding domain-containing protein [Oceanispirochaeta sp. M1]